MITFTRLGHHGQLGNQMFQYAMLLGVSAKTGFKVKIPRNKNARKKAGLVELDKFNISTEPLTQLEQRSGMRRTRRRYCERGFEFDPKVFQQRDGTDYRGYYQTEKYFAHIAGKIREEFTFQEPIDKFARDWIREFKREHLVALHVRRGDYLKDPDYFQILKPEYYQRAMAHPALPEPKQFAIFSDDLDWCSEQFSGENIVQVRTPSHWHDMAVMTYCDSHIISASSFSWWGAWLCHHQPNVVIAPTPWFPAGPRANYNMNDVVPDRWIKQEVI